MKLEDKILELRQKEKSDWHSAKTGVYHASQVNDLITSIVTPNNFYKTPNFSKTTLLTFEIGRMYHDYIQNLFPEAEKEKKIEVKVKDFKIVGRVDLILNNVPIELKTCSTLPKKHYLAHETQLQCYLEGLNKDFGFITYIEKNPRVFVTKNYKIYRDKKLFQTICDKLEIFHEKLRELEPKVGTK